MINPILKMESDFIKTSDHLTFIKSTLGFLSYSIQQEAMAFH